MRKTIVSVPIMIMSNADLYSADDAELCGRLIRMPGGRAAVIELIEKAIKQNDE